jgi:uncharacterized membrane protein
LCALSDGVFAIAMTLLVLDLRIPQTVSTVATEHGVWVVLVNLGPKFLTYFMSFLTLGIFWVGQQTQLNLLERADRDLTWLHLTFLLFVTLVPFSTAFLGAFTAFRLALVLYWLNILLLGVALYCTWHYANRAGMVNAQVTDAVRRATNGRIIIAQSLYALGVLLCLINTYISIGFIVLVQLNYVIAPRVRWLYKL